MKNESHIWKRSLCAGVALAALVSQSAWALEYRGATGAISRSADSLAQVDAACNAAFAGSRTATYFEITALGASGANIATTALVSAKFNSSFQTQYGTEGGGSDEYASFADGLFVTEGAATWSNCHSSTSSSTRGVAFSNAGVTNLNCGSDRQWHCVSGDFAGGGGSGDNLGNHTATQALNMGGFAVNSASGYFHSSDSALKANINKLSGWEILKHITGYSYDWKNGGGKSAGVLAQEVEKVLPSAVATDKTTGTKSVEYDQLIAPMIEAIKELKAENEAMRSEIDSLKKGQQKE